MRVWLPQIYFSGKNTLCWSQMGREWDSKELQDVILKKPNTAPSKCEMLFMVYCVFKSCNKLGAAASLSQKFPDFTREETSFFFLEIS